MSFDIWNLWWKFVPQQDPLDQNEELNQIIDLILSGVEAKLHESNSTTRRLFEIARAGKVDRSARSAAILAIVFATPARWRTDSQAQTLAHAAALLENPVGIAWLLQALRTVPDWTRRDVEQADIRRAAEYWSRKLGQVRNLDSYRQAFAEIEACLLRVEREAAADFGNTGVFFRDGRAELQVISCIGEAESGGGKELTRLYASLLKPLPLQNPDLPPDLLGAQLVHEFPWMEELVSSIVGKLRLRARAGLSWLRLPPLLLVGPPGSGKTRFARRLAELSGCGHQTLSAAGSSDNRMLAGTARGWASAQPCLPLTVMRQWNSANPLIIVDEIEKAHKTHNGSIQETLLTFLESETSRMYFDECLLTRANLGEVSWVATANDLAGITDPLLNRFEVKQVVMPGLEHFPTIIAALRKEIAGELGVPHDFLPDLSRHSFDLLKDGFTRGMSLRVIKRALAASMAVEGWQPSLH